MYNETDLGYKFFLNQDVCHYARKPISPQMYAFSIN